MAGEALLKPHSLQQEGRFNHPQEFYAPAGRRKTRQCLSSNFENVMVDLGM